MAGDEIGDGAETDVAPPPVPVGNPGSPQLVVVEAPWCAECKRMAPLIDEVAAAHPEVAVTRIDASRDLAAASDLGVMATPTLIGFVDGAEVNRVVGRRGRRDLEHLFAGLTSGAPQRAGSSKTEPVLRMAAGILIAGLGVLAGPSWPLLGVGAVLGVYGFGGLVRRGNR